MENNKVVYLTFWLLLYAVSAVIGVSSMIKAEYMITLISLTMALVSALMIVRLYLKSGDDKEQVIIIDGQGKI